jgi:hypothetical protein
MPPNSSIKFTPGLKVGFFGANGSFQNGIIVGTAILPQVRRHFCVYVFFFFFGFYSNGVQDGGELLDIIVKGEKPGKEKQYRLPPFGLIPLEG